MWLFPLGLPGVRPFLLRKRATVTRNIFRPGDFSSCGVNRDAREMEPHRRITDDIEIDYKTSRSICDEVGERLQQDLRLEPSRLPPYLNRLVDELRKRDK
jgi:hypothetical protein